MNTLIKLLKDMFEDVTLNKRADQVPLYYHPDLMLYTNGIVMDYNEFLESHIKTCATPIQFEISYDEETLLEQGNRLAGRMWITTKMPDEMPHEIELILVANYKDGKIHRLWELTYPDWSQLPEFVDQ